MDIPDFSELFRTCAPDVHPQTMTAIVKTESGFRPFAIGVNGSGAPLRNQPGSREEAISTAKSLVGRGYNIDMGYAQINSANLKWLGMTIEDMFDECKNVKAGARILTENYAAARKIFGDPQLALRAALSAYNTGNHSSGIQNGYVRKVSQNAKPLVAYGDSVKRFPAQAAQATSRSEERGRTPTVKLQTTQKIESRYTHPEFVYARNSRKTESPNSALVYQ